MDNVVKNLMHNSPQKQCTATCGKRGNTFTVSHANRHPDATRARFFLDEANLPMRPDMELQQDTVLRHHINKTQEFVGQFAGGMSFDDQMAAVKLLVRTAAERDVRLVRGWGCDEPTVKFTRRVWASLLHQVEAFFNGNNGIEPLRRPQTALEYVSALGLWFGGDMSLPFRRHIVRVQGVDGTTGDAIVIGFAWFNYSSYVMDSRRGAQSATMMELERMSERLGVKLLFFPPLVLPESVPCKNQVNATWQVVAAVEEANKRVEENVLVPAMQ
ncbi:hypothetical protein, conserved [Trypanosoma brucei brucei TREU927]|uniref:Uncharacterized protein n=1 Tax=Trypanosoma brucei brucei (strain 927/4 GUTat10.1) TaxID=185431 RepID=Q57V02_TRYB2|nr:hypothetical protein, conserved [Trypanosoma brucei brucei TREU927]AAX70567.1 hypothetical protein, conserved [Trypanosoma brucei]AAZ12273.1 hypothetical protein, conserved [Trypanosoma brucei brucei TREU927]